MAEVVTIGLDIAKSVFQVHGVDSAGAVVLRRQVRRAHLLLFFAKQPKRLIGVEARASAHYSGRELSKLGHQVRLMPPSYVEPCVKRQKNDAADAEAICEAVTWPTMRFVEIKSPEQQSMMVLHRARMMLLRQRIQLSNAIRAHMAEFGLVAPIGREGVQNLIKLVEPGRRENPHALERLKARAFGRDPSSRKALWPADMSAAPTGRTHGRTDQQCRSPKKPCQGSAVHTWRIADTDMRPGSEPETGFQASHVDGRPWQALF